MTGLPSDYGPLQIDIVTRVQGLSVTKAGARSLGDSAQETGGAIKQ